MIVAGLCLCACGPARPEHDKEMQNARGITKVNEAQKAREAAAKPENKSQARVLEERARAREKLGREWFEKAAAEASHQVSGGDTGSTIASYYGVRFNLLKQANPDADWDSLKPEETITIPGHPGAQFNLGAMHDQGQGGLKKDPAKALAWYLKAAAQGMTTGEFMVGRFHQKGLGGSKRNPGKAVEWYERAARKGHAAALNNLGWMRYQGEGVERNLVEAYKWYALAARQSREGERAGKHEKAFRETQDKKDPQAWAAAVKKVVASKFPDQKNASHAEAEELLKKITNGEQRALKAYLKLRTDDLVKNAESGQEASKAMEAIARDFLNEREVARAKQLVEDYKFEKDSFAP